MNTLVCKNIAMQQRNLPERLLNKKRRNFCCFSLPAIKPITETQISSLLYSCFRFNLFCICLIEGALWWVAAEEISFPSQNTPLIDRFVNLNWSYHEKYFQTFCVVQKLFPRKIYLKKGQKIRVNFLFTLLSGLTMCACTNN